MDKKLIDDLKHTIEALEESDEEVTLADVKRAIEALGEKIDRVMPIPQPYPVYPVHPWSERPWTPTCTAVTSSRRGYG